jgi:hypothetical protein
MGLPRIESGVGYNAVARPAFVNVPHRNCSCRPEAMRRFRDRRPTTLFRGSELPRLLTMVVMLGVLWLLVDRAADPNTWRWIAPGEPAAPGVARTPDQVTDDRPSEGPTDEDTLEQDAAGEEFQAVTDKAPLAKEEMPAYWRLMAWQEHQSTSELQRRSKKSVTYSQLFHDPESWRGKLVEIPMHLRRTARVDNVTANPLNLKTMYEVWGWTSDSQPYWYWLVCPQLPPGMPQGQSIYEEATFVGYFLKLLSYEDHQGKQLATPLLIGRLVWHPEPANPLARRDEWTWPWLAAIGLAAIFLVRWGVHFSLRRRNAKALEGNTRSVDDAAVESWLEGGHTDENDTAIARDEPDRLDPLASGNDNHH